MKKKEVPERLVALSLTGARYNSYAPLEVLSRKIRRAITKGDVGRLETLWNTLQERYPMSDLTACLVNGESNSKENHLALAVDLKNLEMVRWLIEQGVEDDCLTKTNDGDTILHMAAANNSSDIVALYHSSVCEEYDDPDSDLNFVDWTNNQGVSALCVACSKNAEESAMMLLELGASVDLVDCEGNTPLHYAAAYGNGNLIKLLIHRGANAFTKNDLGYTPSDFAYSFEVEQQIQNTVRGVLEANKRARKPKLMLSSLSTIRTPEDSDGESEGPPSLPPKSKCQLQQPHQVTPFTPKALKLQPAAIPQTPMTARSGTSTSRAMAFPTPPSVASPSVLEPSLQLDTQSSQTLQRIPTRDQNAQAGFQTSAALRAITSGATVPTSPAQSANPPLPSIRNVPMYRRQSSSNDTLTYSSNFSSSSQVTSPSESPVPRIGSTFSKLPSSPPPAHPLPPVPHTAKSTTSSLVNRFKRTDSSSSSGKKSPTDFNAMHQRLRGPKHQGSLVDLSSHARAGSPTTTSSTPPLTPVAKTLTALQFGRSRARAGT